MTKKDKLNMIARIEEEMKESAKNLDFERAMELRDALFELKEEISSVLLEKGVKTKN